MTWAFRRRVRCETDRRRRMIDSLEAEGVTAQREVVAEAEELVQVVQSWERRNWEGAARSNC